MLELNDVPSGNQEAYYAGWSRSSSAATSAACIHHPAGDVKKISLDTDPLTNVSIETSWCIDPPYTYVTTPANCLWAAVFNTGTVQPGSSGSPIFDQNHRIVGQLRGDYLKTDENYCNSRRGQFGRFDVSWIGGGQDSTRLSYWLDPENDDPPYLNGVDPLYININGTSGPLYSNQEGNWDVEPSGGTGNYTYAWYFDSNLESTSSTLNYSFDDESYTYHNIEAYVYDGIGNASDNISVGVNPIHYLTAAISGPDQLESGEEGIWYAWVTGGEGERYYFWTIDANFVGDDYYLTNTFYDQEETYHLIGLTATSDNQNAYADPIHLTVYPNKKKMSQENNQIKLNIFPNPATYSAEIDIVDNISSKEYRGEYDINIYDIYGKPLLKKTTTGKKLIINTSGFPNGTYTVTATGNGNRISGQLIIKR